MKNKVYMVFDIIGPNGFIPYVYDKDRLVDIMKWELENIHDIKYFEEIPKISSHDLVTKNEYDSDNTYLIPLDWCLEKTKIETILTPNFYNFIKKRHNFFIIYVDYNYEQTMHTLI